MEEIWRIRHTTLWRLNLNFSSDWRHKRERKRFKQRQKNYFGHSDLKINSGLSFCVDLLDPDSSEKNPADSFYFYHQFFFSKKILFVWKQTVFSSIMKQQPVWKQKIINPSTELYALHSLQLIRPKERKIWSDSF